jgi:hypothetical protein
VSASQSCPAANGGSSGGGGGGTPPLGGDAGVIIISGNNIADQSANVNACTNSMAVSAVITGDLCTHVASGATCSVVITSVATSAAITKTLINQQICQWMKSHDINSDCNNLTINNIVTIPNPPGSDGGGGGGGSSGGSSGGGMDLNQFWFFMPFDAGSACATKGYVLRAVTMGGRQVMMNGTWWTMGDPICNGANGKDAMQCPNRKGDDRYMTAGDLSLKYKTIIWRGPNYRGQDVCATPKWFAIHGLAASFDTKIHANQRMIDQLRALIKIQKKHGAAKLKVKVKNSSSSSSSVKVSVKSR